MMPSERNDQDSELQKYLNRAHDDSTIADEKKKEAEKRESKL